MAQEKKSEWLVVVNPNAGTGKGEKDWNKISALLESAGVDFHAVFTQKPLHAIQLTIQKIFDGYRKFIVVGGDGTMNEVVNGIFKQNTTFTDAITLGMISVGTGNDWGRTFKIPMDYRQAIEIIKQENTMLQDAGLVKYYNDNCEKTRYFINMAGMGFDGLVAQKTNADKLKGRSNPLVYLKNLISSLFNYKSSNISLIVDGKHIREKIFSIGIGIGQYNGGGMRQAPDALPDDGLFDLVLIKDMSKWSVVASVRRLYNGTIKSHKKVETLMAKTILIDSDPPVLLETDGESMGISPFEFRLIPKSIKVVYNPNNFSL
jgi:diacylglycerol kinase (ATP)